MTGYVQEDDIKIYEVLIDDCLQLENISLNNWELYIKDLKPLINSIEWEERSLNNYQFWQIRLQKVIDIANEKAENLRKRTFIIIN